MSTADTEADDRPDLIPDVPIALGKLVRRVLCNNPGMMTGPGTNTYLIGQDEIAVIDPGPDDADHLDAIAAAGSGRIRWILCTHTHGDHSPGAAGLKERTGAEVLAFADRDGLVCDRHLVDGDTIEGTEFTLRVIHTPGHAANHICFLLERDRMLFSGDHIMDGFTVVITPLDGDMGDYLASLERLQAWTPSLRAIAPAHGHVIDDPAAKLDDYITHRLDREAQVLATLQGFADGADTAQMVEAIYTDVPELLWPVARFSVWAHLRKLGDEGKATAVDRDDPDTTWTAA